MEGAIGVKTGFTGKAGYCFVGAIQRGDVQLISVVLACGWPPNKNYKWSDTRALMDYGLTYFKKRGIEESMDILWDGALYKEGGQDTLEQLIPQTISVEGGTETEVVVECEPYEIPELLLADWESGRAELEYIKTLKAPVAKGQIVGNVSFYVGDTKLGQMELKAADKVPEPSIFYCIRRVLDAWIHL